MGRMVPTSAAKLLQLQPVLVLLLILRRGVIAVLAVTALHCDNFAHLLALSFQLSAISFTQTLKP
jgi:hypothetical protein